MLVCSSQVSVPPEKSGAVEVIAYEIALHMGKHADVFVVSRKPTSKNIKNYVVVGSKIRKSKFMAIASDVVFGMKCIGKIRKEKPDILHMHTTFTSFPIMLFRRFLPENTKIVYTSHSPAWTVPDDEIGVANRIFNKIEGYVINRADAVTAVAEAMRKGMLSRGVGNGKKIRTIENFTQPDIFSKKYGKSWKIKHSIKGPVVLFVGKLTETKGVPYILDAAKNVKNNVPDVKFVFVGSLEHEHELEGNPWMKTVYENDIASNVIFTGNVPFFELPKIYSSADILVLPSLREGMPLVIMEALATGLPIVTTHVSGTKEAVNEKCAIFVDRKNSTGISNAVMKILSNKKFATMMSRESKKMSKRFEKKNVLEKYHKLYKSMCD
jgi:glycosyltransferase involved in cell wall biosynthesis